MKALLSISPFSFNLIGQEVEPTSSCREVGTDTAAGCGFSVTWIHLRSSK